MTESQGCGRSRGGAASRTGTSCGGRPALGRREVEVEAELAGLHRGESADADAEQTDAGPEIDLVEQPLCCPGELEAAVDGFGEPPGSGEGGEVAVTGLQGDGVPGDARRPQTPGTPSP